jgi:DNA mismatch endonuclease (patch repair protein)
MRRIKGKNTAPELAVRRLLCGLGLRYRLHRRDLPGRPDFVLVSHKIVIFVHGCFWHMHKGCKISHIPRSHVAYWRTKLETNVKRDRVHAQKLRRSGWSVLIIWECQTNLHERVTGRILRAIKRANGKNSAADGKKC